MKAIAEGNRLAVLKTFTSDTPIIIAARAMMVRSMG